MKKSKIAENIFNILNDLDDYLKYGFKTKRGKKDFSFWDNLEKEKKISIKVNSESQNRNEDKSKSEEIKNKLKKEIIELAFEIVNCNRCELGKLCKKRVSGVGEISSPIFIVSGYLTKESEETKHPLTNNELELFYKWLDSINIGRDKIFITSILKCFHYNKKIEREYIEQCRYYLDRQIEIINPSLIITLGDVALSSLRKEKSDNKNLHGQKFIYNNRIFFTTYHPKDMLKDLQLKKDIWSDLQKIRDFIKKEINFL